MLFCTITYLVFLPLVFALYWSVRTKGRQNAVLLAASMVFYGWWNWKFLVLMVATCIANYYLCNLMRRKPLVAKGLLWLTVVLDFGILGVFKYLNFFVDNMQSLLSCLGFHADCHTLEIILPVGISFYTFQLVGYVVDTYRERLSPKAVDGHEPSLTEFLTFVCFFPQLVAGPIERASHLLPQFERERTFSFDDAREGMRIILWGVVKKMLVADICAEMVNRVFDAAPDVSCLDLWYGALFFTFQIYGDFSGYSDMAIGSARLFGIRLSRNFKVPYFATSMQEFWRCWHTTLMSWFKDYVYIPLGGNRCSRLRNWVNSLVVFALSGLWHGANWTFVCWGLYHGLLLRLIPSDRSSASTRRMVQVLKGVAVFFVVMLGWVIFRSPDMAFATSYLTAMFTSGVAEPSVISRMPMAYIVALVGIEFVMGKERLHPFEWRNSGVLSSQWVRLPFYAALFLFILFNGGEKTPFIYFQF